MKKKWPHNGEGIGYESFYLRPRNSNADEQLMRNHTVQYVSHPDHHWHVLRKDSPGKYESWSDVTLGEWTRVRIEVKGEKAKLFINGSSKPSLVVNDLKLGEKRRGGVGLFVGPKADAYFKNLVIRSDN